MKKNRVCELFGIEYPIIQGGMIWVSGWKLAVGAAKAGILGLIGAGSMTPDLLREHIRKAKDAAPNAPWGVNLPIFFQYAEEMANVILEEGVKIVFTSGGSPKKFTSTFKEHGIKVAHVASTPMLAKKCEDAGVDAVVVEGFEAGGHNGRDEITTMVLVPQSADLVSIPLIAAGGIYNGRTMAAAFALGAEGVQIGTRFVATEESSAHPNFKQALIQAGPTDTRLLLKKLIPVRVIMNEWAKKIAEAEANGASDEELLALLGEKRARIGMFEGDLAEGELEIGQASGAINEIKPIATVVSEIVAEFEETLDRLSSLR